MKLLSVTVLLLLISSVKMDPFTPVTPEMEGDFYEFVTSTRFKYYNPPLCNDPKFSHICDDVEQYASTCLNEEDHSQENEADPINGGCTKVQVTYEAAGIHGDTNTVSARNCSNAYLTSITSDGKYYYILEKAGKEYRICGKILK